MYFSLVRTGGNTSVFLCHAFNCGNMSTKETFTIDFLNIAGFPKPDFKSFFQRS